MILSCPSCSTRFSVPDGAFAKGGRKLRCGKCKHDWFQEPPVEEAAPVEPAEEAAPVEEAAPSEENSQDDIDSMFDAPDPQKENSQDDIDSMFDTPDPQKENSQDDVDAMFDTPDGGEADEAPAEEADDTPPIGISGGAAIRGTQASGGSWVGWTAMVSVLVALVAGLALLSDTVIEAWPPAKRLYAMVGLPFETLGEGLEIRNIEARFEQGPNGSRLIILGDIVNLTRHARTVPMVRVVLRDNAEVELEGWMFQATDLNMMPSETVSFRTAHESPPDGATDAVLGFTEAPVEAAASQESAAAE